MADSGYRQSLFEDEATKRLSGPVECLGKTFESDEARRDHFLERLREKLKESEFRETEGFPISSDEDILKNLLALNFERSETD